MKVKTLYSGQVLRMLSRRINAQGCTFDARGSRIIIVVVQVGAVKISVGAVEVLRKKERQDETQFTTKIDDFFEFYPC